MVLLPNISIGIPNFSPKKQAVLRAYYYSNLVLEKYVLWKLLRIRNESVGKGTEEYQGVSMHLRKRVCDILCLIYVLYIHSKIPFAVNNYFLDVAF